MVSSNGHCALFVTSLYSPILTLPDNSHPASYSLACVSIYPDLCWTTQLRLPLLGTDMEVQYELQAFGISKEDFPLDENGNLRVDRHLEYLEHCRQQEPKHQQQPAPNSVPSSTATVVGDNGNKGGENTNTATFDSDINGGKKIIKSPARNDGKCYCSRNRRDCCRISVCHLTKSFPPHSMKSQFFFVAVTVLLGRGKTIQEHPGNLQLAKFVDKYRMQYLAAQFNVDKSCIIQLIVKLTA